jgi:hypothetical protein
VKTKVIARVNDRLEFVLGAFDSLFYTVLENVKIINTETVNDYVVVAVSWSERLRKRQTVETCCRSPIGIA